MDATASSEKALVSPLQAAIYCYLTTQKKERCGNTALAELRSPSADSVLGGLDQRVQAVTVIHHAAHPKSFFWQYILRRSQKLRLFWRENG